MMNEQEKNIQEGQRIAQRVLNVLDTVGLAGESDDFDANFLSRRAMRLLCLAAIPTQQSSDSITINEDVPAQLRRIATALGNGGGVGHEIAALYALAERLTVRKMI